MRGTFMGLPLIMPCATPTLGPLHWPIKMGPETRKDFRSEGGGLRISNPRQGSNLVANASPVCAHMHAHRGRGAYTCAHGSAYACALHTSVRICMRVAHLCSHMHARLRPYAFATRSLTLARARPPAPFRRRTVVGNYLVWRGRSTAYLFSPQRGYIRQRGTPSHTEFPFLG